MSDKRNLTRRMPNFEIKDWTYQSIERIVVTFDMLSSSDLMEELTRTETVPAYLDLFGQINQFFHDHIKDVSEELDKQFALDQASIFYNFVGDGWIMLFPPDTDGRRLLSFLSHLSRRFETLFRRIVVPHLETPSEVGGLTFGLDCGELHRTQMMGSHEHIGRPLYIACRLQKAVKVVSPQDPRYKALISQSCYDRCFRDVNRYHPTMQTVPLGNIRGLKQFPCMLLSLGRGG